MVKPALGGWLLLEQPDLPSGFQQLMSAEHIGAEKGIRSGNRAVYMRFSGEVHYRGDAMPPDQGFRRPWMCDVTAHELDLAALQSGGKVVPVSSVGQGIED